MPYSDPYNPNLTVLFSKVTKADRRVILEELDEKHPVYIRQLKNVTNLFSLLLPKLDYSDLGALDDMDMHGSSQEIYDGFVSKNADIFENGKGKILLTILQENPAFYVAHFEVDAKLEELKGITLTKDTSAEQVSNIKRFVTPRLISEIILPYDPLMKFNAKLDQYCVENPYPLADIAQRVNWRLFADGVKQRRGETAASYDHREPGCLVAMATAFRDTINNLNPLNARQIEDIHDTCINRVQGLDDSHGSHGIAMLGYRALNIDVGFDLSSEGPDANASKNGKRELYTYNKFGEDYIASCGRLIVNLFEGTDDHALSTRVDKILQSYNDTVSQARAPEAKLREIVSMVTLLERIHPFSDANCRTLCVIVLNRELVRNGFPLCVLDNPNQFDGFSTDELMTAVIKGFDNAAYILNHGMIEGEILVSPTNVERQIAAQTKSDQIFNEIKGILAEIGRQQEQKRSRPA